MQYPLTVEVDTLLGRGHGSGINRSYRCPFHSDSTPSLSVHMVDGVWFCFGCGKKGTLAQLYYQLGETEPEERKLERLVRLAQAEPEIQRNLVSVANDLLTDAQGPKGREAFHHFCDTRPISRIVLRQYNVGYSKRYDAIAFIYWDADGRVPAIKYRTRDGRKFAERDSVRILYGIPEGIGKDKVVICEGESDTLAVASALPESVGVVGSPGAGVSSDTWALWALDIIFASTVYIALDADEAGDTGAETIVRVLGEDRCIRLRPTLGKDWSDAIMNGETIELAG